MKVSRGKFLGGSSGVNGTLCIRVRSVQIHRKSDIAADIFQGTKQDYDDWDMPGWSGDEVFKYMKKVSTSNRCENTSRYSNPIIGYNSAYQALV